MQTLPIELAGLTRDHWTREELTNVETVAEFVRLLMNEHDFEAVRTRFGNDAYVQHNHGIAEGIDGLIATLTTLTKRFPDYGYDVKSINADGDFVVFHSHATLKASHRGDDRRGFNITDRWRVEGGLIVEHWDSVQPMDRFTRFYALLAGGKVRNGNGTY